MSTQELRPALAPDGVESRESRIGQGGNGNREEGARHSAFARGGGLRVKEAGGDDVQAAGIIGKMEQSEKLEIRF